MVPLIGYLDRLSARPGEDIAVKVSCAVTDRYQADLVRIIHADPNPAGPGMKIVELTAPFAGEYPARTQPIVMGSYAEAALSPPLTLNGAWTVAVRAQPWLLAAEGQTVVALVEASGRTLGISLRVSGAVGWISGVEGVREFCAVDAPPQPRRWYELRLVCDGGSLTLSQTPLQRTWGARDQGTAQAAAITLMPSRIMIGAQAPGVGLFDGRIEDPMLVRGAHCDAAPLDAAAWAGDGDLLAWWDFADGIDTESIRDGGPGAHHGRLANLPTRGARGSRWDGSEMAWRHKPRHYAAIHFHSDDLSDCRWQTDFSVTVPDDLPSGVYGIRLRAGEHTDTVPFYVLPPRGVARAPIVYLAPTFTYQAYFNHARGNVDEGYRARRAAWRAYPHNPDEHPEYGRSTYNEHPDGSGICFSSLRRPLLTMRPGFLTFNDARGSGLRHFPADSHLTDWLEAQGFAFDVITDHDLHREGAALLAPYRSVVTGSHPEYHTRATLDALQQYVGEGGRLAYLGGNGFYWKIAVSDTIPDVLEIRRAEGGIRAWAAEAGESCNALDGTYGGMWRRNGRPPQLLAGIGFSAQGLFESSYYRRLPSADDPRAAWIFDGVPETILGNYGLSGGGAAGFELDRSYAELGSPPNLIVLARSEGHQSHFVAVPEEVLSHVTTLSGEPFADLIRAEIVYFETDKGGAAFSVGSITFCGSLSHDGYRNPLSRMLRNVLTRFSATS
jgi:N,N-dimethylformamidase